MSIGIYKYENKLNGKIYIGQSQNIENRYKLHLYDSQNRAESSSGIDIAIQKYGIENFDFQIVELCNIQDLDNREKFWIEHYNSYNEGYNRTIGGSVLRGEEHPRAILSEEDVWNIREQYNNQMPRRIVFKQYIERGITERCLLKVWNHETWIGIHSDVYTKENKEWHKKQTGHSIDQFGLSSLNRAITQEEIDIWVKEYENGMSINAISKKYKRDNGTVKKYIDNPNAINKVSYNGRRVKNIETGRIFKSISAAAKWAGCGATTLTRHLVSDKQAGVVPDLEIPAHWIELS